MRSSKYGSLSPTWFILYLYLSKKGYAVALPKFAIDFLKDYKYFINNSFENHNVIRDEIIKEINHYYDDKFNPDKFSIDE